MSASMETRSHDKDMLIAGFKVDLERLRKALEPFAGLARIKGGTPEADKLRTLVVYMMEHNKPGEGVDTIYQFASACLQARDALTESASANSKTEEA